MSLVRSRPFGSARRYCGIPALLALACMLGPLGCATPLEREQNATALPFARQWVEHLDAGSREAAWAEVSEVARLRYVKESQLTHWFGSRQVMGPVLERNVIIDWRHDADLLSSVPDGVYWEVEFRTEFEQKDEVSERLLLRWEDGRWRMFAFYLR